MLPFTVIVPVLIVVAFIAVLLNSRFLLYPLIPHLNPVIHARRLSLSGTTLFISDLHLKFGRPLEHSDDLRKFIIARNVTNLVVNGDWFDSPEDALGIIGNNPSRGKALSALGLDGLPVKIFWVAGSPTHDPLELQEGPMNQDAFEVLGRCALISTKSLELLVYHGHDLSAKGAFGHAWDRFVGRLSLERLWKRMAKVNKSVWVVFGHTHVPGVDLQSRVANSGGWKRVPLLVQPSNTGLLLYDEADSPQLVQIALPPS